jgi:hypothetical protein
MIIFIVLLITDGICIVFAVDEKIAEYDYELYIIKSYESIEHHSFVIDQTNQYRTCSIKN